MRANASFRLRLLGAPLLVDDQGQTPAALGWGKPLALLAYLAIRGEVRRDEIVDLLWRDVSEDKARNAFRQALHRLRTALGGELIPHDRDRVRLADTGQLAIDASEFEREVRAARFDAAIALYGGDFLESLSLGEPAFDLWAEQVRTTLRARFRDVLLEFVQLSSAGGQWQDAIAGAKRLQRFAPHEPEAAKLLATTLVSAGRRSEALDSLRLFSDRTKTEFGLPTPDDVQALIDRLAREELSAPVSRAERVAAALPFTGREADLSRLMAVWRLVSENSGALVLIEGEAGIGKTRLLHEFIAHTRALSSVLVLHGRERAAGAQLPYGIFAEALRPLVHAPGVAGASAHLLAEAARLLPEMRDSMDLPAVAAVEDEASRLRFFEGIAALVDAAAYEQPLIIVLDALQHVPPSSLDLLSYLATRLAAAQVMFVLTIRPSDAPHAVLGRLRALTEHDGSDPSSSRARRLVLAPLSTEVSLLAIRDAVRDAGLSPYSAERIARQSQGNPSRLEHAVRGVAAGHDVPVVPIPLKEVFLERIQRLSSVHRRVLLVLSLFGRPVRASLAAAAAHVSEPAFREAVRTLERHGLLSIVDLDLLVVDDVAATAVVDAGGDATRVFLSGWIADALACEPTAQNAELARFYASAGNAARAFACARLAAFDALGKGARAEAAQLLNLALGFAPSDEDRGEIESALEAIGAGRQRLSAGPRTETLPLDERAPAEAGAVGTPAVAGSQHGWERLFPHWRTLFGAAVATLLISAIVLGSRLGGDTTDPTSQDTLIVSEGVSGGPRSHRRAVGGPRADFALGPRTAVAISDPAWIDSLPRQWMHAVAAPRGSRVALVRVTPAGSDLMVIGRDRRDSVLLLERRRGVLPRGWSPDGSVLLATAPPSTAEHRAFDTELFAIRVADRSVRPIDVQPDHAVTEAVWSPDGSHIAWVARVGSTRQQDVFTSLADGSDVQNVSQDDAEDYHIGWSPTGEMLVFTSTRDGNSELYAADLIEHRLWRLTRHDAHDDRGIFSPDGRSIAFESTRRGFPSVYVMPALGGQARLVGGGVPMELIEWQGPAPPYLDYVRIRGSDVPPGDSTRLSVRGYDAAGDTIQVASIEWRVLDSSLARLGDGSGERSPNRTLVGLRDGVARVVATMGHWRSDTAFIRIGGSRVPLLSDEFSTALSQWRALGDPAPRLAQDRGRGVLLQSHSEWDSGVLTLRTVPLMPLLTVEASVLAPWGSPPDASTEVSLSLVVPEEHAVIDSTTPQFLRLASMVWKADAGRFAFAVGKDVFTQPVSASPPISRRWSLVIERDSTVTFMIDGTPRWRSTLRLAAPRAGSRAQIWISGRGTGDQVRLMSVSAFLAPADTVVPRQ